MVQEPTFERSNVHFASHGQRCFAWHYVPASPARTPASCIVMAHGLGGTIDAGLEPFAEAFAGAGHHVLLFDYRHFGRSDGEPRQLLSVARQLEDWAAAIDYARHQVEIDGDRIGAWGTSFSGGHVVTMAARDTRLAAVSAQGPMLDGLAAVQEVARYAGIGQLLKLTAAGIADQCSAWFGAAPVTVPLAAPPGQLAAMSSHDAYNGYQAIAPPDWRNEMTARLALTLSLYRPIAGAERLHCPVLIGACLRDTVAPVVAAKKLAERAPGKVTLKEYDIGHFDIYLGAAREQALADQLAFFNRYLLSA